MFFIIATLGLLVLLFLIMVVLVRAFERTSVADIIDWKPTRSPEVEAQNEVDDVRQMIEAQNALRRRRAAAGDGGPASAGPRPRPLRAGRRSR